LQNLPKPTDGKIFETVTTLAVSQMSVNIALETDITVRFTFSPISQPREERGVDVCVWCACYVR